jgi:hypothetical protein
MRWLLVWAAGLQACASGLTYTASAVAVPAKPRTCDFLVLKTHPSKAFEEIGIVDVVRPSLGGTYRTATEFKDGVRSVVCDAGGDAVLVDNNPFGLYMTGTVIRWMDLCGEGQGRGECGGVVGPDHHPDGSANCSR